MTEFHPANGELLFFPVTFWFDSNQIGPAKGPTAISWPAVRCVRVPHVGSVFSHHSSDV
ncbi:hypothetical protein [Burkholderia savannae]|uniref:hypothetical protein n=1 Tax=Burkholderia savannae TaxID=1637837 RepID=UPI000A8B425D|nr:hypothetical protein [Burkholderia savannae]